MQKIKLDSGLRLEIENRDFPFELAFDTYGQLNTSRSNVKWVFHALTASSDAAAWWPGLFGKGKILDPSEDFIVCANMIGSCYGTTGPLSINPLTNQKYYHQFPLITIRDQVNAFRLLKKYLGIDKIGLGIGGSMGGSVLLEWNAMFPEDFENSIYIATSAKESSWGKAIHTVHKMAIENDPSWKNKDDHAGSEGLKIARGVGMLFYRTADSFNKDQVDHKDVINNYKSDSYIRYQGQKLVNRFNAFSYYFLLNTLDTHHLGRSRPSAEFAMENMQSRSLIIGIDSDILYPVAEQKHLKKHIPKSELVFLNSNYGHDGFLTETVKINKIALEFMY